LRNPSPTTPKIESGISNGKPWQRMTYPPVGRDGAGGGGGRGFSEDFWRDLAGVWAAEGKSALESAVKSDPIKFCTMAASVLPKDVNVKHEATDAFLQLWKLISDGQAETVLACIKEEEKPVH
jgi:hypothetical protein